LSSISWAKNQSLRQAELKVTNIIQVAPSCNRPATAAHLRSLIDPAEMVGRTKHQSELVLMMANPADVLGQVEEPSCSFASDPRGLLSKLQTGKHTPEAA
jgi:hypothetical protein